MIVQLSLLTEKQGQDSSQYDAKDDRGNDLPRTVRPFTLDFSGAAIDQKAIGFISKAEG